MQNSAKSIQPVSISYSSSGVPHWSIEYAFYTVLTYSTIGSIFDLAIPLLAGGAIAALAAVCMVRLKFRLLTLLSPLALLLACGVSFILIQVVVFEAAVIEDTNRSFITWMLGVIIVRSLCLRPGFPHRFAIVLFLVGVATLPYLGFLAAGTERARIDEVVSGNLSNPNGLGEWFGFCAVYFAILGLQTKHVAFRVSSWGIAVVCLYVVGLTVSRGALLAAGLALVTLFRGVLRRGFVPVVLLMILTWVVYESGLFQNIASNYAERGTEETGRLLIWPVAIQEYLNSPLLGLGSNNAVTYVPATGRFDTPHNGIIYFALSSGVVPLLLFAFFWIQSIRGAFSSPVEQDDREFRLPLLIFTLIVSLTGDLGFMSYWAILATIVGAGSGIPYGAHSFIVIRDGERHRLYAVRRRRPAAHRVARY